MDNKITSTSPNLLNNTVKESLSAGNMDLSQWQVIQDSLADITGLPLALYDQKGNPLSSISGENKIVKVIMDSPSGKELFQNFYRESIEKAFKAKRPLTLRSPLNQHFFIVPLTVAKDNRIAVIGGYSFLTYKDFFDFTKRASSYGITPFHLSALAKEIKFSDFKVLSAVSKFVAKTANSLINTLQPHQESSEKLFRYKTLLEITTDLSLYILHREAFQQVFHTLSLLFDIDDCSLMVKDKKGEFRTKWALGRISEKIKGSIIKGSEPIIQDVIAIGKPIYLVDLYHILEIGFKEGVESVGIFPILKRQKTFALLNIFNTSISDEEKRLIQSFCRHLSLSLESHELKAQLLKRKRDFTMLSEINKALSSVLGGEELHKIILDKSTELLRARQGSLMLINSEGKDLVIKAIKGINEKLVEHLRIKVGDGIAGKVFEDSTPLIVNDIEEDQRFRKKSRPRYSTRSFVSIPLQVNSRTIGVLNISDKITGEVFTENDLNLLLSFASNATVAIERSELYTISEELRKISITDPLTGLLNRRFFQERLSEEIERSKRHDQPFTFMMIDIDDFKSFNDSRGHLAGDDALKRVSKAIRDSVRTIDVVSRYGGEEFSVILPLTDKVSSLVIAERIRQEVESISFYQPREFPEGRLTLSIGIASLPQDAVDATGLINSADKALYLAKAKGKNMVVLYEKEKFKV